MVKELVKQKSTDTGYSVMRARTFTKQYATNSHVTITDSDIRIELFNEKFQTEQGWLVQSEAMVILSKEAAKKLAIELADRINEYEKDHGEIAVSADRMEFNYLISS